MKNQILNSHITTQINGKEKTYTPEQYLPLMEGLGICYQGNKNTNEKYVLLKQYYCFQNVLTRIALFLSITLELLPLVYLSSKTKIVANKNLNTFGCTLLVCDISGSSLQ